MVDVAKARRDLHVRLEGQVPQAQLAVMSAQYCPMTARTVLMVSELLNVLLAADALYCRLLALVCRLRETRERGNMVDFWRAVGEIERFARERGA